jgi:hypothetical protein
MAAIIFQKIKNNMQSGRAQTDEWVLEFDAPQGVRADPLTGWQGSGDTQGQVRMMFPTRDAAIAYAEREGIDFHVVPQPERKVRLQVYADNFQGGNPVIL